MKTLRLKRLTDGEYERNQCAVSGCKRISAVIDGTHKMCSVDVPLCEEHWCIRADMTFEKRTKK